MLNESSMDSSIILFNPKSKASLQSKKEQNKGDESECNTTNKKRSKKNGNKVTNHNKK